MPNNKYNILLIISMLCAIFMTTGCSDSQSPDDSAAEASAQLGLGGDDLSQPSQSLTVVSEGAQVGVWTSDYPAAQRLAQEQELPMLLFFNGSDWSVSSNALIQKLLDNREWNDYAPHLVLVYLDRPRHNPNFPAALKEQNDALRIQFRINDYPSMLLCTADGQLAGNLRVNSQTEIHDLVRDIKLFRRRIPSEIDKLVAQIEDPSVRENYANFKAASEAKQKLIEETQTKLKELDETMLSLGNQVEEQVIAWEISRRTPEDQQAYHAAAEAQKPLVAELNAFMATSPANTPENQRKFQELQSEIQRQQRIIDEIIAK